MDKPIPVSRIVSSAPRFVTGALDAARWRRQVERILADLTLIGPEEGEKLRALVHGP